MSEIDLYDVSENLISSDEYSEEDDDELMNAAISSQQVKPINPHQSYSRASPPRSKKPNKLPFRKKLCNIYKTRCIKWLNDKQKRDKYKQYMLSMKPKTSSLNVEIPSAKEVVAAGGVNQTTDLSETINLEESDVESFPNKNPTTQHENEDKNVIKESREEQKIAVNELLETSTTIESTTNCQKRTRSISPTSDINCNEPKKHQIEKPSLASTPGMPLYKEINEMFYKYDEVVGKHIKKTSSTIDSIDENMTRLLLDIQTLNDILHAKEIEWNRLLHLKRVKEEILARLERKKHILEFKDKKLEDRKYNLQELKELEIYLSEGRAPSTTIVNNSLSTAQQLIESRANMKTEDLQKERLNTNRLQSILVSSNILQRADESSSNCNAAKNNLSPKHNTTSSESGQELQSYQYLERKLKSNMGRQGPFKDVKSIIADFRQKNPDVFPRVGKRVKTNDTNCGVRTLSTPPHVSQNIDTNSILIETTYNGTGSNYTPTLEKLLSTSTRNNSNSHNYNIKASVPYSQGFKFNCDGQKSYYRLQDDGICNEISITPISGVNRYAQRSQDCKAELLRTALDTNAQHNAFYDMTGHKDLAESAPQENELQLCQHCKTHEARFVCAGCGNQWYCSRRCQISAWDKHSEICNE